MHNDVRWGWWYVAAALPLPAGRTSQAEKTRRSKIGRRVSVGGMAVDSFVAGFGRLALTHRRLGARGDEARQAQRHRTGSWR
ncbi:hypothetical protein JOF53_003570 [Crossiella equi]|uniref:Secreted protein n=1 Tax=Crossiella equi TaxID=130796 RepID=A0ABS5ADN2_9PSEU|nr:hypothetical protein [Crossiella equi]MBP2474698.1 hypothetical protein [Crossiella equi]